jgi:hypothetical protein
MDRRQLSIWKKINTLQVDEILAHKWIESEKAGRDLGNDAVLDWISKYAAEFRAYWEKKLSREI